MAKRILVIDDDESVRDAFKLTLEDGGYHVDTAESGEKGILKFKEEGHDLIYLDLKMPGLDGVATLYKLRKISDRVPIYIVTAFHDEYFNRLKSAAEKDIGFEIIRKPVDDEQLLDVSRGILGE